MCKDSCPATLGAELCLLRTEQIEEVGFFKADGVTYEAGTLKSCLVLEGCVLKRDSAEKRRIGKERVPLEGRVRKIRIILDDAVSQVELIFDG